jgi:hypothetical protein
MKNFLCSHISGISLLRSVVSAKTSIFAIDADVRSPSFGFFIPSDTKESRRVALLRSPLVAHIVRVANISQIRKSIVRLISVNVVNFFRGPFSMNIKPCESMDCICSTLNHGKDVSLPMKRTDNSAFMFWPRPDATPGENAGLWIVADKVKKFLMGDKRSGHDDSPLFIFDHFSVGVDKCQT